MSKAVKYYSRNSGHCFANFTIQLIFFLHVVYCSVVYLVAFFILSTMGLSFFFNAFQHWALLPSSRVYLLLGVFPFLVFVTILFLTKKATMKLDWCGWPQKCRFVITTIWMKMQTYSEKLYRLIFTAYMAVWHSPNCFKHLITLYLIIIHGIIFVVLGFR